VVRVHGGPPQAVGHAVAQAVLGDAASDAVRDDANGGRTSGRAAARGAHQALNASAAAAAGLAAGVPLDVAAAALATASPSRWRMELRDLAGGATLLNDSYNANTDSTRAALDALAAIEGGRRIAVLGEMLELGDDSGAGHRAVGEYASSRADVVVAVGEAVRPIADGAGERAVALADNDAARRSASPSGQPAPITSPAIRGDLDVAAGAGVDLHRRWTAVHHVTLATASD
jgi:UDP-N-acetylmuramyl pentapeptide synthase